jgi:hypothetical protein
MRPSTKDVSDEALNAGAVISEGDPVANSLVRGCLLVREALREAYAGSGPGGPTTHSHRRLDLAERWCTQPLRLIPDAPNDSFQGHVVSTANRVRTLVSSFSPG